MLIQNQEVMHFQLNGTTHTIGGVSATKSGDTYSVASGNPKGFNDRSRKWKWSNIWYNLLRKEFSESTKR